MVPTRFYLLWACTLSLAGCAVGPDYHQPNLKLPETWQTTQPGKLEALQNWWAHFNDPVLLQLQATAQKDSPTLDKALAAIDKARANRSSARASYWPSVDATAQGTESGTLHNSAASDTVRKGTAGLDASWEMDLFGKTRRTTESADALLDARQADWHDARISLAAEVASDYVDYRACQIKQKYYEAEAESQNKTAQLTQISAQAGFTAPADARLAQASAAKTLATALEQKVECEVLLKSLVALTGQAEPTLRQTLATGAAQLPVPDELKVTSVPAALLRQRPDVVSAERELAAASASIGVAEAARWPSLTLKGSIALSAATGTAPTLPWSFGPTLNLPLLDGGTISANIKSARADYDSKLATYKQTVRDAVKEVEQGLVRLDSIAQREAALQQSAAGYRTYLTATEQHLRAGGASQLDLETARRSAISAEVSLLELQQNRLTYWIALYKAVGGGWQAPQGENP